jgi:hypothetical protein
MVGSWPCKVLSEIHINGGGVSEPVREDKGKTVALELEDRRDLKRAHVLLSKDNEVVGPGYSWVIDVAAKVTDKREDSGNHSRVNWVSKTEQHYPSRVSQNRNMDRQADRVGWVSQVGLVTRVSPNSSTDRRIDRVGQVSQLARLPGLGQTAARIDG